MTMWLHLTIFSGYLSSWVCSFVYFETEKESYCLAGKKLLAVTLILHSSILIILGLRHHVTAMSWLHYALPIIVISTSMFLEWRKGMRFLLLFSLPLVLLVSMLIGMRFTAAPPNGDGRWSFWVWFHVGFILAGMAGLVAAVSSALMYLVQSRQLKSRHLGGNFLKLPALEVLDKMHFRSMVWGAFFLSLGLAAGVVWASDLRQLGLLRNDPKAMLSLVSCLLYWLVIGVRMSALRRGQKIAVGTLAVFLLLFLSIASAYIVPGALHRGGA